MKKLIYLLICLSLILTTSLTLLSCADNSGARDDQNDTDTTTASKDENDEPLLEAEPMRIDEGYTVISQSNFKIKVTENEETTLRWARIATLKDADGESAVYIDVLDDELKIKALDKWRGRVVVELCRDDTLAVMQVIVTADKRLLMSTSLLYVTDQYQKSDYTYGSDRGVDFFSVAFGYGTSDKGSVESAAAIRKSEQKVINFFHETVAYVNEVKAFKPKSTYILLADTFSQADISKTYSDTEKTASLFENEEFVNTKLNFDHVLSIYSLSRQ